MLNKKTLWINLICLALLTSSPASAETPHSHSEQINQFHQIQQPLGVKIAVTVAGLALIGIELWWFIFSKSKASPN
jgi:plastocyanin domain-containing protein